MIVTNISDFRKDTEPYLDRVTKNFETLIINRAKDSGIVISLSKHTIRWFLPRYELSSRTNEKRLDSAIEKLKNRTSFSKEPIEN